MLAGRIQVKQDRQLVLVELVHQIPTAILQITVGLLVMGQQRMVSHQHIVMRVLEIIP